MFMINGEVYVGLGGLSSTSYADFYRYSPSTDTWERIEDLNGIGTTHQYFARMMPPTFVIDGVAYLGGGMSGTMGEDWWKYDPSIGLWERLSDFHQDTDYASSFVLNGKGYMISGQYWSPECWEYDPVLDTWRQVASVGHTGRNGGFAFVVNGTPYAGGGGEDTYEHFFQLDTKKLE